jgi:hypothetical protein
MAIYSGIILFSADAFWLTNNYFIIFENSIIKSSMKPGKIILVFLSAIISCSSIESESLSVQDSFSDGIIKYQAVRLTDNEKEIIRKSIADQHSKYDVQEKMLTKVINGYNYHTDAETGTYHEVRASFNYAVSLLDLGEEQYRARAFDIIEKTISLQDQAPASKSCGVWPYYMEEPLAAKKTPIDYNWADFNAVSLLDVWMGHQDDIPDGLKEKIKNAIILAAKAIEKRNVGPSYTNIAIMGTYVTYVTSHLFGLTEMQTYAGKRLKTFYDYTIEKGGFTEYNSPTYTIVALDELFRMKQHITEPGAVKIIESLYFTGWEIIARHYHRPSGQWTGPHSRSYNSLVTGSFYAILQEASEGVIVAGTPQPRPDVKIKHKIPEQLMKYFLTPLYPRTETDMFEKSEPVIEGNSYMTGSYALSTASRSGMWNQRRPFLAYWRTEKDPAYLQIRMLHDMYDFSSASFYSQQKENCALACINFVTGGGDKHISIDRLIDGKFRARDLRLRFEFGNIKDASLMSLPSAIKDQFSVKTDGLRFNIQVFETTFADMNCYWQKGGDSKSSWIDLIIYSGEEKEFNLSLINRAVFGFTFTMGTDNGPFTMLKPIITENNGEITAKWNGLTVSLPVKPLALPKNL